MVACCVPRHHQIDRENSTGRPIQDHVPGAAVADQLADRWIAHVIPSAHHNPIASVLTFHAIKPAIMTRPAKRDRRMIRVLAASLKLRFLDPTIDCVGNAQAFGDAILTVNPIEYEVCHPLISVVDVIALELSAAIQRGERTAREIAEFIGIAPAPALEFDAAAAIGAANPTLEGAIDRRADHRRRGERF